MGCTLVHRDFHEHLERLGIPHAWTVLPGVDEAAKTSAPDHTLAFTVK